MYAMSPAIYSPVCPSGSLSDCSFGDISFSPSSDSLCPLLSPDDVPHPSLFDSYISEMVEKDMHRLAMGSTSDLSDRSRSSSDEARMFASPSQGTITQKTIRPSKVKKKRSLGQALKALKSSSHCSPDNPKAFKPVPLPLQIDESSFLTVGSEDLPGSMGVRREEEDGFDDRNRTVRRRNMPHHPFRYEDAPYMQAYSQILLENDFQTHELLRRLSPADSPTFHHFGKKPPAEVLDLGCGEGFWVLHAAKMWKSHHTKVTGLDLIDLHNNDVGEVHPHAEPAHIPKNVTWFRSNFVKYELPFPDDSFDLVRMANLTLCIPINRWRFVLTQVRRVLKPGGRLELIDDDMFFPNILPHPNLAKEIAPHPPPKDNPLAASPSSPPKFHTQRAVSSASCTESPFIPRSTSLSRSTSQRHVPDALRRADAAEIPSRPHHQRTRHARSPSEIDYTSGAAVAGHLETIFGNMLAARGISPHPHHFLGSMLREVFGPDCARQTQHLELAVPSRELCEAGGPLAPRARAGSMPTGVAPGPAARRSADDGEKGRPGWMTIEWDSKKEKRTSEDSFRSVDEKAVHTISPKARQLLFGDDRDQAVRGVGPYQPPGLLLLPGTFIPFSPLELEMHACKNMNTLLGCKYALANYVTSQRGPDGAQLVSESEVDDYLWDYECFRRKRFNWPQDIPGLQMEDDPEPVPQHKPTLFHFGSKGSPADPNSRPLAPMYGGFTASNKTSTHVRTIRVYEALKVVPRC